MLVVIGGPAQTIGLRFLLSLVGDGAMTAGVDELKTRVVPFLFQTADEGAMNVDEVVSGEVPRDARGR